MKEEVNIWCKIQANPHNQTRQRIVRVLKRTMCSVYVFFDLQLV